MVEYEDDPLMSDDDRSRQRMEHVRRLEEAAWDARRTANHYIGQAETLSGQVTALITEKATLQGQVDRLVKALKSLKVSDEVIYLIAQG